MLSQKINVDFQHEGLPTITLGTGKLARQADGAVTVTQGNCILLATVVANKDPKEGQEFFPLSVDYQEKFASAGRIPGSFFKREARLNDYEILTSRLIDRASFVSDFSAQGYRGLLHDGPDHASFSPRRWRREENYSGAGKVCILI